MSKNPSEDSHNYENDDFDAFVTDLQEEIYEKDRQDFSAYALELGRNPYHYGCLPSSKNVVKKSWRGPCGDQITFYLEIEQDIIKKMTYEVDGCVTSSIAGSQTVKMVEFKSLSEAKALKDQDILKELGKFPPENYHCATLAATTLHKAIEEFLERKTN